MPHVPPLTLASRNPARIISISNEMEEFCHVCSDTTRPTFRIRSPFQVAVSGPCSYNNHPWTKRGPTIWGNLDRRFTTSDSTKEHVGRGLHVGIRRSPLFSPPSTSGPLVLQSRMDLHHHSRPASKLALSLSPSMFFSSSCTSGKPVKDQTVHVVALSHARCRPLLMAQGRTVATILFALGLVGLLRAISHIVGLLIGILPAYRQMTISTLHLEAPCPYFQLATEPSGVIPGRRACCVVDLPARGIPRSKNQESTLCREKWHAWRTKGPKQRLTRGKSPSTKRAPSSRQTSDQCADMGVIFWTLF